MTAGNGGMLVTDNDDLTQLVQSQRDHGMASGAWTSYQTGEFQEYPMIQLGFKYIMWDIPASIALHQLRRIEQRHKKRLEAAARYEEALKSLADHVELLKTREGVRHAHHLYVVRLKGINRNRVVAGMETRGISVGIHYRPVHLEPYYREKHGHVPGEFPVAEDAGERVLSLPFWPEINDVEILRVVETLGDVITECRDS